MIVRITQDVRMSKGQIIRAVLYFFKNMATAKFWDTNIRKTALSCTQVEKQSEDQMRFAQAVEIRMSSHLIPFMDKAFMFWKKGFKFSCSVAEMSMNILTVFQVAFHLDIDSIHDKTSPFPHAIFKVFEGVQYLFNDFLKAKVSFFLCLCIYCILLYWYIFFSFCEI